MSQTLVGAECALTKDRAACSCCHRTFLACERRVSGSAQMETIRWIMGREGHPRARLSEQEGFLKKVTSEARPER